MPGKVTLDVSAGPLNGHRWEFTEHDTLVFGRQANEKTRLHPSDTTASRHHFILEVNLPDARIRDLGSLNGTYVNGVKHGGREAHEAPEDAAKRPFPTVELRGGDVVEAGSTRFTVSIELPSVCCECGVDIPDNFKSVCGWIEGALICPACREKLSKAKIPPTLRPGPIRWAWSSFTVESSPRHEKRRAPRPWRGHPRPGLN
jgi:serine/threonine-protein kinase